MGHPLKSRTELKTVWNDAVRLREEVHENSLDEGQVRRLLPRSQGEWVRWIGPIDMVSKGAHWERWTPSFGQVFVTAKVESGFMIQAAFGWPEVGWSPSSPW